MAFDTQLLPDKIEKLKQKFEQGNFADAIIGALNTGNGLLQQRVFTENKDVLGNGFGKYVGKKSKTKFKPSKNKLQNQRNKKIVGLDLTAYQRKRAAQGAQINPKNLELSGGLRRSIITAVQNEKAAVLEFNNDESAIIARGLENQTTNIRLGQKGTTKGAGIRIFRLSKAEKEEVIEQGLELIKQELAR